MNRQSIWNRRIPSVAGIAILIVGVIITSALVSTGVIFTGRAAPGNTPQNVVVSNITDTSFTVTYSTSDTVLGSISYINPAGNKSAAFDIRDQKSGQPRSYRIHAITINNLTPQTKYTFSITSGGGSFTNNGSEYVVTTGKKLAAPTKNPTIKGKVVLPDGKAPKEALIYIQSGSSQILSTIASNGNYSIPTALLRTKNLSSHLTLSPTTRLQIQAIAPEGKAIVSILTKGSNPVPPITLENKYDFATTQESTRIASQAADVTGFPEPATDTSKPVGSVAITAPKEGQALSDQRPTIKGTAPPSAEVEITIDTEESLQGNVMADRQGNWTYRPKNPIPPGVVAITVNARDDSGIVRSTSQSFTVLASGSQFTEPSVSPTQRAATPTKAATPTRTPTPTPGDEEPEATPTAIATPTVAVTPTQAATPTVVATSPTPTTLPTIAPTVATSIQPTSMTPAPSIPPTGDNDAILYALIGAVAITIGAVLLFITGGISL